MDVEQIVGVIGDPSSWKVRTTAGGDLVIVKNPSGFGWIKMEKGEAIRLGLWKEQEARGRGQEAGGKMEQPAKNKMRRQGVNK